MPAIDRRPPDRRLTFGINGGAVLSCGHVPFQLRSFIQSRGIPAMRCRGDDAAQAELRWQFRERLDPSLTGHRPKSRTPVQSGEAVAPYAGNRTKPSSSSGKNGL